MFPVATSRDHVRKCLFLALTVAFAFLLMPGKLATGAEGIQGAHRHLVLTVGRPANTAGPVANTFEISKYEVAGAAGQSADPTAQLYNELADWNGLVSDVKASNRPFLDTVNKCDESHALCDVVGITEEFADDHMVLKLTVRSFPKTHRDLHKQIREEEHDCNPRHCGGREGCRNALFKDIVEELAGLDKDHKGR